MEAKTPAMHTHELRFSADASSRACSLLELTPELLHALEHDFLQIRGDGPDSDAVLCSSTQTYALRLTKSSNSLLLCKPLPSNVLEVDEILQSTIQPVRVVPRADALRAFLRNQRWDFGDSLSTGVTIEDIRSQVLASDAEINDMLRTETVAQISENCYRMLASPVPGHTLATLLLTFVASVRSVYDFSPSEVIDLASRDHDLPAALISQVIEWFSLSRGERRELDMHAVVRELARACLADKPTQALDLFNNEWRKKAGDEHSHLCTLDRLKDMTLVDGSNITYISASSLPADPLARFNYLFALRARWRPEDMEPFLKGIASDDKERERWILKAVRKVRTNKDEGNQGILWAARLSA